MVMSAEMPNIDDLRKWLVYEEDTGRLFSKKRNQYVFSNKHHSGYLKGAIGTRTFTAHRVCAALKLGYWPDGEVDHINGVRDDNRWQNLRVVSKSENQRNAKKRKDNKSGATGVFQRKSGSWCAYINKNTKKLFLGTFKTYDEAIAARKSAEKMLGYTERHGS
jgi:hypothetical protein